MNSWCESCARKNCCYTMEIRPRCYVATTNTASGTPESYLAKSLRYSQDRHEIAKTEPQTEIKGSKRLLKGSDEPQTDTDIAKAIVHKMIDDAVIAEDAYPDLRQKMHDAVDEYEPQTERSE